MSVFKDMFSDNTDDIYDDGTEGKTETLLAEGTYKSSTEMIMTGYKIFRKKYVYNKIAFRLFLVLLAIASSVMMIVTNYQAGQKDAMPFFFILIALSIGIYFVQGPIANMKKLKAGIDELEGTEYKAEIFTDKIRISTLSDNLPQEESHEELTEEKKETANKTSEEEKIEADIENEDKDDGQIPATIIHLDSPIVDFLDKDDMYILVVKKSYVFIIPKSAFKAYDVQTVKDKLSNIMGIRYKAV